MLKLGYKVKSSTPKNIIRHSKKIGGGIMHLDRLTGKYLDYNYLKELPASIKNLSKLQIIILSYNKFEEVPFELSCLKNLKYVNLVGCYGMLNKETQLKELKSKPPASCMLRTDLIIN